MTKRSIEPEMKNLLRHLLEDEELEFIEEVVKEQGHFKVEDHVQN